MALLDVAGRVVAAAWLVPLTLMTANVAPAAAPPSAPAPAWTAYVANFNASTVTPIDTATNTAGTPIAAGRGADSPQGVAVTPDGKTVYVANPLKDTVTPIDTATNTAGPPIAVGGGPFAVAITPDGETAYVTNPLTDTVTPIDTATNTPGPPIAVGSVPQGLAVSPDGKTVYVANYHAASPTGQSTLTPIDTATDKPGTSIVAGHSPYSVAITPDGKTAYVTNPLSNNVIPVDLATKTAGPPIAAFTDPTAVAITPDGKIAYVTNETESAVTPIDTATNRAGNSIAAGSGSGPNGIAITPDGKTVYVTNEVSDGVTPIDTATDKPGPAIRMGRDSGPFAVAVTPDQAPVAHLSVAPAPAGAATGFDASASTVAYGTIASYAWDFGDGSKATTSSSTSTHTYSSPGTYTASVTETSAGGTSTTQVFTGQTMSRNGGPQATTTAVVTVVRKQVASSTKLSVTPSSATFGQGVAYRATVSGSGGMPSGTVDFSAGSTKLCTATLSGGTGSCTAGNAPVGTDTVTGVYSGDPSYAGSSGKASLTVTKASTATRLTSSANPSVSGQSVTFTATVSDPPGVPGPTGTVTFRDGGSVLGTVAISGGQATFTTSSLSVGTYSIVTVYSGDSNDASSSSPALRQQVLAPGHPGFPNTGARPDPSRLDTVVASRTESTAA